MPLRASADVLKIFVYLIATLLLAAVISPWLYQFGKGLAEVFEGKDGNRVLDYLALTAGRAEFPRFFDRALLLSAVILWFPFLAWLRLGRESVPAGTSPWSLRPPEASLVVESGQPLRRNPRGWLDLLTGLALAAGLLLLSGWVLVQAGAYVWKDAAFSTRGHANRFQEAIDWVSVLKDVLPRGLIAAVVEEVVFRGVLLGILLRAMRPAGAVALMSLLFAFVHFLQPPAFATVADPESSRAGFELLGRIAERFAEPRQLVTGFAVLLAVGLVLAYARVRTASLWLPIGLHAGWILGLGVFKAATWPVAELPEAVRWFVGASLREGLIPLSVVIFTGMLVHLMTRETEPPASFRS